MQKEEAYRLCQQHMHRYVLVQLQDGSSIDGIIEKVDVENVYLAVPIGEQDTRAFFGYPGFGYGFPGHGFGFGYPFFRPRFRPFIFPLTSLLALSLLPYY